MDVANVTPVRKRKRKRVRDDPTRHSVQTRSAKARAAGIACTKCGQKHENAAGKPTCNGHLRRVKPPKACMRPPIPGGTVCDRHGGQFGVTKENAARRVAFAQTEGQVAALLRELDMPEQHPIDGLLEVVRHSGAMMRLLGMMVAQLDLDPGEVKIAVNDVGTVQRYTEGDGGLYGLNHSGDGAPHVLVVMYDNWATLYMRACKLALDANIDERLIRNAESTTEGLYKAISIALTSADLDPVQAAKFSDTLALELRKLMGPLDLLKKVEA